MEQNSKKSILPVENGKKNITIEFFIFELVYLSTNFQLKLTSVIFRQNLPKKDGYFQPKRDKIDTTIEFCIFKLVFVSNLTLNKQFCIFGLNLPEKNIYGQK